MDKVLKFLSALQKNNNKAWFDAHRPQYEEARQQFLGTVDQLIRGLSNVDPGIGTPAAKECVFRINRDVRFSNNKSPYKNNMAAVFAPGGKKSPKPCYYVHVQPGASFIAAGVWMPEKEVLAKIRQEIDYEGETLLTVLKKASFKKYFKGMDQEAVLVRMPKGYEEEHPMAEYLKFKSFTVTHALSDAEVLKKGFADQVLKGFREAKPFNDFLLTAFEE